MPNYDAVPDLHAHRPEPTTPDTPEPGEPPEPDQPDTVPEPDTPPIGDPPPQPTETPHTHGGIALTSRRAMPPMPGVSRCVHAPRVCNWWA